MTLYKSPTHGLRLKNQNPDTTPADIVVYHYLGIPTAANSIRVWDDAYKWYNEVVPGGSFVTIMREPLSHYLSYYYFYTEPKNNSPSLEEFVEGGKNANILMRDFGVHTKEEMDRFMAQYAAVFKTILLSDRMHESLVILAKDLGWCAREGGDGERGEGRRRRGERRGKEGWRERETKREGEGEGGEGE